MVASSAAVDTPGYAYSVEVAEGRAYVADGKGGLRIIDVSAPPAIREIGSFLLEKVDVRGVDVRGPYAYLAAGSPGLAIVDVSDPGNVRLVGQSARLRSARAIRVAGRHAFVTDLDWLRVFDVSDPSAPDQIASYQMPAPGYDVWVEGETAYVAAYDGGLIILGLEGQAGPSPNRTGVH